MTTTISDCAGWSPIWEEVHQSREWGKYPPEYVIRFLARNFYGAPKRDHIRLLDLGCGAGACTWYFAREGFAVSGIDGSKTAIKKANYRLNAEGLSAELQVGDFTNLPWPNGHFDAVVDNLTLCCNRSEHCRQVVSEVDRVLKPGGRLLSAAFSDRTWGYGLGRSIEPGGFSDVTEGPLRGLGFVLFMGRSQLDELYSPLGVPTIERVSWTLENTTQLVEVWVVEVKKSDN